MTDYVEKMVNQQILFLNNLRNENYFLKRRLLKYKLLYSIKETALNFALSKIIDTCKYCKYKTESKECKKFSCEKGMKKYFMEAAEQNN